jgi:hypothetical protein
VAGKSPSSLWISLTSPPEVGLVTPTAVAGKLSV